MDEEINRYFNRYIAKLLSNTSLSGAEEIYFKQQMRYLQRDIEDILHDTKGLYDGEKDTHTR